MIQSILIFHIDVESIDFLHHGFAVGTYVAVVALPVAVVVAAVVVAAVFQASIAFCALRIF